MATNINQIVTQSLQRQFNQVTMQQNEDENVVEGEVMFVSDVAQFHTQERV